MEKNEIKMNKAANPKTKGEERIPSKKTRLGMNNNIVQIE